MGRQCEREYRESLQVLLLRKHLAKWIRSSQREHEQSREIKSEQRYRREGQQREVERARLEYLHHCGRQLWNEWKKKIVNSLEKRAYITWPKTRGPVLVRVKSRNLPIGLRADDVRMSLGTSVNVAMIRRTFPGGDRETLPREQSLIPIYILAILLLRIRACACAPAILVYVCASHRRLTQRAHLSFLSLSHNRAILVSPRLTAPRGYNNVLYAIRRIFCSLATRQTHIAHSDFNHLYYILLNFKAIIAKLRASGTHISRMPLCRWCSKEYIAASRAPREVYLLQQASAAVRHYKYISGMRSILITGCNRGLGLGLVKNLAKSSKPPEMIFATCRDVKKAAVSRSRSLASNNTRFIYTYAEFLWIIHLILAIGRLSRLFNDLIEIIPDEFT